MNEIKAWYTSRAVWSGIVVILVGVAGLAGYTVSEADQAKLVDLIVSAGAIVGGLGGIIFRIKASKTISKAKNLQGLQALLIIPLFGLMLMTAACGANMTPQERGITFAYEAGGIIQEFQEQYNSVYPTMSADTQQFMREHVAPVINTAKHTNIVLGESVKLWLQAGGPEPANVTELRIELNQLIADIIALMTQALEQYNG